MSIRRPYESNYSFARPPAPDSLSLEEEERYVMAMMNEMFEDGYGQLVGDARALLNGPYTLMHEKVNPARMSFLRKKVEKAYDKYRKIIEAKATTKFTIEKNEEEESKKKTLFPIDFIDKTIETGQQRINTFYINRSKGTGLGRGFGVFESWLPAEQNDGNTFISEAWGWGVGGSGASSFPNNIKELITGNGLNWSEIDNRIAGIEQRKEVIYENIRVYDGDVSIKCPNEIISGRLIINSLIHDTGGFSNVCLKFNDAASADAFAQCLTELQNQTQKELTTNVKFNTFKISDPQHPWGNDVLPWQDLGRLDSHYKDIGDFIARNKIDDNHRKIKEQLLTYLNEQVLSLVSEEDKKRIENDFDADWKNFQKLECYDEKFPHVRKLLKFIRVRAYSLKFMLRSEGKVSETEESKVEISLAEQNKEKIREKYILDKIASILSWPEVKKIIDQVQLQKF